MLRSIMTIAVSSFFALTAVADKADVIDVEIEALGDQKYKFSVTLDHLDDGWDHYTDAWQVLDPDGEALGTRELAHPHVEEMPFTRSKVITVPAGIREVTVRARDLVHGWGGKEMKVTLPAN